MATKTEELINTVQREVTRVQTLVEGLQDEVTRANLIEIREHLAVLDATVAELKKRAEESERRNERLAVLETQHTELKKQFEEKDRRWWQFWIGVGAIGITFVANLVINLFMFFARKSG